MRHIIKLLWILACLYSLSLQLSQQNRLEIQGPKSYLSQQKLSYFDVRKRAKQITVRVSPFGSADYKASGIIVDKQEQKLENSTFYIYLVLTNNHVLEGLQKRAETHYVETFDNKVYPASLYQKVNWNGNDLGFLFFVSSISYDKAILGDSHQLKEQEKIFVAGFPCTDANSCEDRFTFTSGQAFIQLIQQKKHLDSGYQLGFDNQTRDGMSGGPVIDQRGLVVGVNGRGKYQKIFFRSGHPSIRDVNPLAYMDGTEPLPEIQEKFSNYAWAIPIETYLKYNSENILERIAIEDIEKYLEINGGLSSMLSRNNNQIYYILVGIIFMIFLGFIFNILYYKNTDRCLSGNSSSEKTNQKLEIKKPEQIKKMVEQSIVSITQSNDLQGSGVIICQTKSALFILTSIHVIGIKPSPNIDLGNEEFIAGDPYLIHAYDGQKFQKFEVRHDNYKHDVYEFPQDTDLVVLKLDLPNSQNNNFYKIAKLTNQVKEGMDVYTIGYLPCSNLLENTENVTDELIQFSEGKVLDKKFRAVTSQQGLIGYDIVHSSNTIQGMSGSPMFDASGRVLGIHAATEENKKRFNPETCQKMPEDPKEEFGNNWGISIKKFAQIINSHLRINLPTLPRNLKIDKSPLPVISSESK